MWISGHQTSSVLSITGILLVHCYVGIVVAIQFLVWSVVLWISDTLYISKFFCLGLWLPYSFDIRWPVLYPVHWYSSLQYFTVSCVYLSICLHVLLVLCAPGCNITRFRWTQPCKALHFRLMLQFGHSINCLSLECSALWCKLYFVMTANLEWYLFLVGLGICAAWASLCVWIGLCYWSSKINLNSLYMFVLTLYIIFIFYL